MLFYSFNDPGLKQGGLEPLANEDLERRERRIRLMPGKPLAADAPKKMSIAGAQQKLLVVVGEYVDLFEPKGAWSSTHILEPDVASEYLSEGYFSQQGTGCSLKRLCSADM